MNKLTTVKRAAVLGSLVEGVGVNATVRMTGVSKPTILKLLASVGEACVAFHDAHVRDLKSVRVEADEIWSFCYARNANVPADLKGQFGFGDTWTWTAIDADTKLMISWLVSDRSSAAANAFMFDLVRRLANRVQLTTDGLHAYLRAVDLAFGTDVDFATLHKVYASDPNSKKTFTPPVCISVKKMTVTGDPDPKYVSTSYVERSNLTMRMHMRRFTRLTNAHSKKIDNHVAAVALHFTWYNFCRVHQTLRVTPAMAAGLTDHVWDMEEIVALLDADEKKAA